MTFATFCHSFAHFNPPVSRSCYIEPQLSLQHFSGHPAGRLVAGSLFRAILTNLLFAIRVTRSSDLATSSLVTLVALIMQLFFS